MIHLSPAALIWQTVFQAPTTSPRSLYSPNGAETAACDEVNLDAIHCVVLKLAANLRMLTPSVRTALIRSMSKDLFTSDDCQGVLVSNGHTGNC
jgi:hypothetical protein